jgi:hypothetical protein
MFAPVKSSSKTKKYITLRYFSSEIKPNFQCLINKYLSSEMIITSNIDDYKYLTEIRSIQFESFIQDYFYSNKRIRQNKKAFTFEYSGCTQKRNG